VSPGFANRAAAWPKPRTSQSVLFAKVRAKNDGPASHVHGPPTSRIGRNEGAPPGFQRIFCLAGIPLTPFKNVIFADREGPRGRDVKSTFCDGNHRAKAMIVLGSRPSVESGRDRHDNENFPASRTRWVSRLCLDAPTEGFPAHAAECRELVANRWHEESKRRYEELARYSRELAEQRQRCA
jgi:hypothetical protein